MFLSAARFVRNNGNMGVVFHPYMYVLAGANQTNRGSLKFCVPHIEKV